VCASPLGVLPKRYDTSSAVPKLFNQPIHLRGAASEMSSHPYPGFDQQADNGEIRRPPDIENQ